MNGRWGNGHWRRCRVHREADRDHCADGAQDGSDGSVRQLGCDVEARGSHQKGGGCVQRSGAGTGLGDGRRDYGHAALRGMCVRDGDDEGAAAGVEGREVPVAYVRACGLRCGVNSVEAARESSGAGAELKSGANC